MSCNVTIAHGPTVMSMLKQLSPYNKNELGGALYCVRQRQNTANSDHAKEGNMKYNVILVTVMNKAGALFCSVLIRMLPGEVTAL